MNEPEINGNGGDGSFRDSIATINEEGKRNWIYPTKPNGWYTKIRQRLSYLYLIIFFGLPFIKVNGESFMLFNILERKFILFGKVFWPHDFFIFGIAMLTMVVFVVLFTVVFGRVFCGWACPQTIFMEMVFRRIEYWIEGDANHQKALNRRPWDAEKIRKKVLKHSVFFLISFIISNTFLAYIIGIDELFKIISEPVSAHLTGFMLILVFSGIFYAVFSWFREQVCIIVCPYGRLQGVMLDPNSIVVAYDHVRGEPRHKFKKNEERSKGDCIDCSLCVKVCPTGIDIRNGTQLECVNCTACIDACDHMMENVGLPKGLIRYASENSISKGEKKIFTRRTLAYSFVLLLLVGFLGFLLASRTDVEATILRTPGKLFYEYSETEISNMYNIKVVNKTMKDIPIELRLENMAEGKIQMIGNDVVVGQKSKAEGIFFVILPKEKLVKRKLEIEIGVYQEGKKIQTVETNFLGPFKKNK